MNKLKSLISSRRFWAGIAGVVILSAGESFGLDEETRKWLAGIAAVWIAGDSLRKTE